jgi:ActR/RegA family two-component response regulator
MVDRKKKRHRDEKRTIANSTRKNTESVPIDSGKRPRVLIVDDDKPFRESLAALFQQNDFEVDCRESVNASIDLVCRKPFDVIVLDMYMPEQVGHAIESNSGLVVTTLLRKYADMNNSAILVVLTGYPSVQDCFAAVDAGAYYLPKCALDVHRSVIRMGEELVRECGEIIRRRSKKPKSRVWMADYYTELLSKFPGQAIGILDKGAETGDIKTISVGECKVVSAPSIKELKAMILQNSLLRKAMPVMLEIWKEENQ